MKSMAAAGLAAALCLVAGSAFAGSCAPASAETDVPQTLTDLFAVARTDDEAGFRQLIAEDFYAYDNGKRFEGIALFQTLKGLHAAGRRFEWSVTEPRVTVVCDVALNTISLPRAVRCRPSPGSNTSAAMGFPSVPRFAIASRHRRTGGAFPPLPCIPLPCIRRTTGSCARGLVAKRLHRTHI